MRNDFYPAGAVNALLNSAELTSQTKAVLIERLHKQQRIPITFFDDATFALLEDVSDVLFPQGDKEQKIPLAILFEDALVNGAGKGWRYKDMPPMKSAITNGLKGIEEEGRQMYQLPFAQLSLTQKETVLTAVQTNGVRSSVWQSLSASLFFEEFLALLTEIYYSHPIGKTEIGDVSFADARGWTQLGLNHLEDREPQPLKPTANATV